MTEIDKNLFIHQQDLEEVYATADPVEREAMICSITTYRAPNKLNVSDVIPSLEVTALANGQKVDLRVLAAERPLVLFFGSYT
jgi:hypothetical protein